MHNGNPDWHPSGKYIVFQAQDPSLNLPAGSMGKYVASPGVGINNNLWLAAADGSSFWQLTHVGERSGTLHPQFSPDGAKLLWSEVIGHESNGIGRWEIKLADFSVQDGQPQISHIRSMRPADLQLYEVHGFSPDGKTILFSGIQAGSRQMEARSYGSAVKACPR